MGKATLWEIGRGILPSFLILLPTSVFLSSLQCLVKCQEPGMKGPFLRVTHLGKPRTTTPRLLLLPPACGARGALGVGCEDLVPYQGY